MTSASETLSETVVNTTSAQVDWDESVADSSTDYQITAAIDVSAVKSFYLVSDQAVTVETNSGSSPADTLTLVANVPYIWHVNSYDTFKFGTDITAFFITNASGSAAVMKMRCVLDSTP